MLFHERSKIAIELLKKQPHVTFEMALAQVKWLSENSESKNKKQRPETEESAEKEKEK